MFARRPSLLIDLTGLTWPIPPTRIRWLCNLRMGQSDWTLRAVRRICQMVEHRLILNHYHSSAFLPGRRSLIVHIAQKLLWITMRPKTCIFLSKIVICTRKKRQSKEKHLHFAWNIWKLLRHYLTSIISFAITIPDWLWAIVVFGIDHLRPSLWIDSRIVWRRLILEISRVSRLPYTKYDFFPASHWHKDYSDNFHPFESGIVHVRHYFRIFALMEVSFSSRDFFNSILF